MTAHPPPPRSITPQDLEKLERASPEWHSAQLAEMSRRAASGASDADVATKLVSLASSAQDRSVQQSWINYFAASKNAQFLPLLEAWLSDPQEQHRLSIISAIAWNRGKGVNNVLLRTIADDSSQRVRQLALKYLVRRGSLGEWIPCDISTIVHEEDWIPVRAREYTKLMRDHSNT